MKKILITGGSGFIARNLKEQLNNEFLIESLPRTELNLLEFEKVFNHIKTGKYDVIIHTATYDAAPKNSLKDPAKVLENNLKMFFNIVRCKEYFGKMIYFGSGAEYDRKHWIPKMKENYFDKYVPEDQYGFSKYIMTKYAYLSNNIYNLRLFAVFGKYENWSYRVISNLCCKAILNLPLIIHQNKSFDFLYIDDLVRIVKWFIDNKSRHKVYNVCSGEVFDFETIAKKIVAISGEKLEIMVKEETSIEYSGDNSLLLSELGNFHFTPIDKAIKSLYEWYMLNIKDIDKKKFHY